MTIDIRSIETQCSLAKKASYLLSQLSTKDKNIILNTMADTLITHADSVLSANEIDISNAKKNGTSESLLDRLKLTLDRVNAIAESIRDVSKLQDPIGEILAKWTQKDNLLISKARVPIGVIGMIYEARPNVTVDAISLCIKTNNAVVLRGSSSAYHSNSAIATLLSDCLTPYNCTDAIQLLDDCSREGVKRFVCQRDTLDLIIPRGGAELIKNVVQTATVPTIETGSGNCHVYIDKDADLTKAIAIAVNSKVHRPSVCNSCETILVHQDIAPSVLPVLIQELQKNNVEVRGCEKTLAFDKDLKKAIPEDWNTEFNDLIVAVKIISSIDDAIHHIQTYGTRHTEAIVSENHIATDLFKSQIDAAAVMINTSTRFTDGGEFGFGAEIGISTQKLHARGPMGLPELTSYKFIVEGNGQIRK